MVRRGEHLPQQSLRGPGAGRGAPRSRSTLLGPEMILVLSLTQFLTKACGFSFVKFLHSSQAGSLRIKGVSWVGGRGGRPPFASSSRGILPNSTFPRILLLFASAFCNYCLSQLFLGTCDISRFFPFVCTGWKVPEGFVGIDTKRLCGQTGLLKFARYPFVGKIATHITMRGTPKTWIIFSRVAPCSTGFPTRGVF